MDPIRGIRSILPATFRMAPIRMVTKVATLRLSTMYTEVRKLARQQKVVAITSTGRYRHAS